MIENLSMSIIQCIIVMLTIVFVGKIIIWYPIKSTGTLWFLCMLALKIFCIVGSYWTYCISDKRVINLY